MKALLTCLLCVTAAGLAQAQPSRFSREKYVENGDTLSYRMLFPDANRQRKYPLVIFLHGSGERGSDNDAQLKWGVMNFATDQNMLAHPAIVIAPQCPEHQTWSSVTPDKNRKAITLNAEPSMRTSGFHPVPRGWTFFMARGVQRPIDDGVVIQTA